MSDLPASAEETSIESDNESVDSYVDPILCILGSDGQIIDDKKEEDESLVYNILIQASKSRKSIVDSLHHGRHLSFQAKTLRKTANISKRSMSRDLLNDEDEPDDDLLFVTKKSVHTLHSKSATSLTSPVVSRTTSRATSRAASFVAIDENVYNRFEEIDESRDFKKKGARRKVKIVADNDSASHASVTSEKQETNAQSYVYDPGQVTAGRTSRTPEDAQQFQALREAFLQQQNKIPILVKPPEKEVAGTSRPMARDQWQEVDLPEIKPRYTDLKPVVLAEKKPNQKEVLVERDVTEDQFREVVPPEVKPRFTDLKPVIFAEKKPKQKEVVVDRDMTKDQFPDVVPPEVKPRFTDLKPVVFAEKKPKEKEVVPPEVKPKFTDLKPVVLVEKKPSKQKEVVVARDVTKDQVRDVIPPEVKPRLTDLKPVLVAEKTPSKPKEVLVERDVTKDQVREVVPPEVKPRLSDIKPVVLAEKKPSKQKEAIVKRDNVNVKRRESPQQVNVMSKPIVKSQSVKSEVPVKSSERKPSYVPLQKFDDVNVKVKSKNIKAIEASERVWKQHGTLEEGEDTPLAESTTFPDFDASKIDDSDKFPRVQVDFNASVLESKDINYLSRLPVVSQTNQAYVPVLYTFRVKPKDNRKLEHLTTQTPPFYVLLDHTIAVIWTLFNANANKEGLGIAQLQWALYFLQQIHNVDGVAPKDVNLCIEAIQEYLIDEYSDISEESVMYGGACLGDYVPSKEKEIPFSLNYSQMIEKSVAMDEEEPLKALDKEFLEEFENVKRLVGIESIDLTTAISRDKTIIALNDWKREQIDKIQEEVRLLRTVEDMMKSVDDTLVTTNEDELTILFNASKKS